MGCGSSKATQAEQPNGSVDKRPEDKPVERPAEVTEERHEEKTETEHRAHDETHAETHEHHEKKHEEHIENEEHKKDEETDNAHPTEEPTVHSSKSLIPDVDLISLGADRPDFGESSSLTAKHLTPETWEICRTRTTASGCAFDIVINSGAHHHDSGIGCYAPDASAYETYSPFFNPVIEAYHGHKHDDKHHSSLDASEFKGENPDPKGKYIVSTRIRVGRNLAGYPFAPAISREQRKEVEQRIVDALQKLEGKLSGKYHSLETMDEEEREKLVKEHFLFKKGDRFLESAGANRDWPEGRGIYFSDHKRFIAWVNEEDHLRVISMQHGGKIHKVFARLCDAIKTLEKDLEFAHSERLGYLTSCPTNLGTAMRASVHIKIPHVSKTEEFKQWCADHHLSVRGVHGEHSESEGGVYDISNKRRLGYSEVECVQTMYDGIVKLIAWEKKLKKEHKHSTAKEEHKEEEHHHEHHEEHKEEEHHHEHHEEHKEGEHHEHHGEHKENEHHGEHKENEHHEEHKANEHHEHHEEHKENGHHEHHEHHEHTEQES